jgi:anthranilate phosphoribosyltransferase
VNFAQYIEACLAHKPQNSETHQKYFCEIFNQGLDPSQVGALLVAWRAMGESVELLTAGATELLNRCEFPAIDPAMRPIADNCGTGGDGLHTFNISTAASIVCSTAGLRMLKHGNRSVSSKCGSADLLFELGYRDSMTAPETLEFAREHNFAFLFAPNIHSSIKTVMPARKALGIRTIFNLLGPLANPCRPDYQVVGVANRHLLRPMAAALQLLGTQRAVTVHSRDGMDEVSPAAVTDAVTLFDQKLKELTIDPQKLGLHAPQLSLVGGDAKTNAAIFHQFLQGEDSGILRAVTLNAGLLLWVAGKATDMQSGCEMAKALIQNGTVKAFWDRLTTAFGRN